MNRRDALRSLAVLGSGALAGCQGLASNRRADSSRLARTVSVASVDSVPDEHAVRMDVELLEDEITADRTARLRVTTTNVGRKRAISVSQGQCCLLNRQRGGSDDPPGLWLHRPETTKYIDRRGDRWVRDRPADEPRGYLAYGCLPSVYGRGESVSNEYALWDDYRVDGYLAPGTYRWQEEIALSEPEEPIDAGSLGSFAWGFSLALENP